MPNPVPGARRPLPTGAELSALTDARQVANIREAVDRLAQAWATWRTTDPNFPKHDDVAARTFKAAPRRPARRPPTKGELIAAAQQKLADPQITLTEALDIAGSLINPWWDAAGAAYTVAEAIEHLRWLFNVAHHLRHR